MAGIGVKSVLFAFDFVTLRHSFVFRGSVRVRQLAIPVTTPELQQKADPTSALWGAK